MESIADIAVQVQQHQSTSPLMILEGNTETGEPVANDCSLRASTEAHVATGSDSNADLVFNGWEDNATNVTEDANSARPDADLPGMEDGPTSVSPCSPSNGVAEGTDDGCTTGLLQQLEAAASSPVASSNSSRAESTATGGQPLGRRRSTSRSCGSSSRNVSRSSGSNAAEGNNNELRPGSEVCVASIAGIVAEGDNSELMPGLAVCAVSSGGIIAEGDSCELRWSEAQTEAQATKTLSGSAVLFTSRRALEGVRHGTRRGGAC